MTDAAPPARDPLKKPLAVIDRLRRFLAPGEPVLLLFSGGKESLACAHLLHVAGIPFQPYFMWCFRPNLSFHQQVIGQTERRYGVTVRELPHWNLGNMYRVPEFTGGRVPASRLPPRLRLPDIERVMRRDTPGARWVVQGQRADESLERRAMISQSGKGLDLKGYRAYPLAYWTEKGVHSLLKQARIPMSPEYYVGGSRRSYGGSLDPHELLPVADHFPADFAVVVRHFPGARLLVEQERIRLARGGKKQVRRG